MTRGEKRVSIDGEGYRWACAAGDRTAALWQRAEAVRWYRQALALSETVGATTADRAALARRLTAVGLATEPARDNARPHVSPSSSPPRSVTRRTPGGLRPSSRSRLFRQGKDEEAQIEAAAAIARLEPLGESEALAVALHSLAQYLVRRGRDEEGDPIVRRALSMGERVQAPVVVADSMQTLAMTAVAAGSQRRGRRDDREGLPAGEGDGDVTVLLRVYNNYPSIVSGFGSDFRRAIDVLREGIELAERAGAVGNLAWLLGTMGDITAELGDLQETERTEGGRSHWPRRRVTNRCAGSG